MQGIGLLNIFSYSELLGNLHVLFLRKLVGYDYFLFRTNLCFFSVGLATVDLIGNILSYT